MGHYDYEKEKNKNKNWLPGRRRRRRSRRQRKRSEVVQFLLVLASAFSSICALASAKKRVNKAMCMWALER